MTELRDITCYISFSNKDGIVYAEGLYKHLKRYGVRPLMPGTSISPGSQWIDTIQELMDQADVLILIGTRAAFRSDWVLQEARYFQERGRGRILPIVPTDTIDVDLIPPFLQQWVWLREESSALLHGPSDRAVSELLGYLEWPRSEPISTRSKLKHESAPRKRSPERG